MSGGWRTLVGLGRRSDLAVASAIGLVLVAVAFGAVAAPRWLAEAEATSLERAVDQAPRPARQLSVQVIRDFGPGSADDPLADQRRQLDEIASGIDPTLLDRYGPARFVADTSRFSVIGVDLEPRPDGATASPETPPPLPTFLTFRLHPGIDAESAIVEGRAATPTDRTFDGHAIVEFELSSATAAELGWNLGETVLLASDATDLVTRQFDGGLPDQFVAELVGLRELSDPAAPYWFGDERLHRPSIADTGTGANVFAFGLITPEQLPTRPFMVGRRSPFFLEQRRDLDVGSLTLDTVEETLAGLVALEAGFSRQPTLSRPGVTAPLGPVLELEQDQRRAARSTLVLAAVGVLGVAVTTLAQLWLAWFARRRAWLTVARARGGSRSQMVVAGVAEAAGLATVALAVGGALAVALVGGSSSALERALLGGAWCSAVFVAGFLALTEGMRPVHVSGRPTAHPGLGRWGRIGGGLLVVVAVGAVVTFRRRGLAIDAPGIDPLIVLLPVLVPLAIVYLTRWSLPLALGRVADRGLGLGLGRLVGLRRIVDHPEATLGVVTVLVLSLTVGALGLGVDRSLDRGAVDASWTAVGAPYRLDTRDVAVAASVRALPGAVVSASGSTRINVDRGDTTFNVQFFSVDVADIARITAGTAADAAYPEVLSAPDPDGRIPAITSHRMGGTRIRVGDELAGLGSRSGQVFVVVETRAEVFGRRTDWLLADRSVFAAVSDAEPTFNSLAIDVADDAVPELRRLAASADAELDERLTILERERDDPLSRAVRRGYLLAAALATLLALLALVAVAVVTARERRREVAVLGLLGAGRREISRAVAAELIPATVTGTAVGALVGFFVVRSYDGRYDLSAFAAGSPVSIRADLVGLLTFAVVLLAVAIALIVALTRRIVRAPAGEILRIDGAA